MRKKQKVNDNNDDRELSSTDIINAPSTSTSHISSSESLDQYTCEGDQSIFFESEIHWPNDESMIQNFQGDAIFSDEDSLNFNTRSFVEELEYVHVDTSILSENGDFLSETVERVIPDLPQIFLNDLSPWEFNKYFCMSSNMSERDTAQLLSYFSGHYGADVPKTRRTLFNTRNVEKNLVEVDVVGGKFINLGVRRCLEAHHGILSSIMNKSSEQRLKFDFNTDGVKVRKLFTILKIF